MPELEYVERTQLELFLQRVIFISELGRRPFFRSRGRLETKSGGALCRANVENKLAQRRQALIQEFYIAYEMKAR